MSNPEFGYCSLSEYEKDKQLLVTPDQLSIGGLYEVMLLTKAPRPEEAAVRMPAKVHDVIVVQPDIFVVEHTIETPNQPAVGTSIINKYMVTEKGLIEPRPHPYLREGFFRYKFDENDDNWQKYLGVSLDLQPEPSLT